MKKFLSTILTISILALPVGLLCLAYEKGGNEKRYLVEHEDAIKRDLKNLTGFETTNLLYRASEDGFNPEKFAKKCKGHSNTVVVVKVKNGDLIGGYVSIPWFVGANLNGYDEYDKDENAFLFSLTRRKIYPVKRGKEEEAIYGDALNESGPVFGANDLHIMGDFCDGNYSVCNLGIDENSVYESNGDNCGTFLGLESSNEEVHFYIEDYEVYEVENTVANNSVCGGHPRKARVNIEDGSICWYNFEGSHNCSQLKRKTNADEMESNEEVGSSNDSESNC